MNSLFNLSTQMGQIGKMFVVELKNRLRKQVGVDGIPYKKLAPSTIAQKVEETNDSSNADKRMIRWGDFMNNAFRSENTSNDVRIFIGRETHGAHLRSAKKKIREGKGTASTFHAVRQLQAKAVMMDDLARYQLESGNSNFFPQSESDVQKMDSFPKAKKIIEDEARKQALNNMKLKMQVKLSIG